jgi:hypothetical protein
MSTGPPGEIGAHRGGARFWITAAVGWAVIIFGLRDLLHHHLDTRPPNVARFVIGGALIHDLLVAPVVLAVGLAVARIVPGSIRAIVQTAFIVSGTVTLFSYPLVRGYAHILRNPSSLPHNYTANLAVVLGCVWGIAAIAAVIRLRRLTRS